MYAIDWAKTRGIAETTGCCFVPCPIVRCLITNLVFFSVQSTLSGESCGHNGGYEVVDLVDSEVIEPP